jgi:hypothetical protein
MVRDHGFGRAVEPVADSARRRVGRKRDRRQRRDGGPGVDLPSALQ